MEIAPSAFPDAASRQFARASVRVLALLLGAGIAGTFALAYWMPEAVVLVPAVLVGLAAGSVLLSYEDASTVAAIVGSALLFNSLGGEGAGELLYDVFLVLHLALWYGRRIGRTPIVETWLDILVAALVGSLLLSVGLGLVYGAAPLVWAKESTIVLAFLLYFPVRHLCTERQNGLAMAVGSVVALGVTATLYTVYVTVTKLLSATAAWQILRVRAAGTEVQIVAALVFVAALLSISRKPAYLVASTVGLGILLGGLILTKSRGYWLGSAGGLLAVWVLAPRAQRTRLLVGGVVGGSLLLGIVYLLAGDLVITLLAGLIERASSISSAAATDPSLLNRFRESAAVWHSVRSAPILGHGMGATYEYFSIEGGGTWRWSYIHNGFAALFFKQGVVGFVLTIALWAVATLRAAAVARRPGLSPLAVAAALGAAGFLPGLFLTAYTSSPFYMMTILIVITTVMGIAGGVPGYDAAQSRPEPA